MYGYDSVAVGRLGRTIIGAPFDPAKQLIHLSLHFGCPMSLSREKNGEVFIVSAAGQINSANAAEVEKNVLEWVEEGERKWILDMGGLEYISSAGLRVVLLLAKRLKQNGGHLVLCSLQPHVLEVFDISGFLSILDVAESREMALERHR